MAGLAAAILITTLYARYAVEFEIIAYTLLVIAAVLNQNVFLAFLNRRVRDQAGEIDALNRHPSARSRIRATRSAGSPA